MQPFPKRIEQAHPRLYLQVAPHAIDVQRHHRGRLMSPRGISVLLARHAVFTPFCAAIAGAFTMRGIVPQGRKT
jgi:hypothetical protein